MGPSWRGDHQTGFGEPVLDRQIQEDQLGPTIIEQARQSFTHAGDLRIVNPIRIKGNHNAPIAARHSIEVRDHALQIDSLSVGIRRFPDSSSPISYVIDGHG